MKQDKFTILSKPYLHWKSILEDLAICNNFVLWKLAIRTEQCKWFHCCISGIYIWIVSIASCLVTFPCVCTTYLDYTQCHHLLFSLYPSFLSYLIVPFIFYILKKNPLGFAYNSKHEYLSVWLILLSMVSSNFIHFLSLWPSNTHK